ncbi:MULTISPECIES: alpha/beta hydrolase [Hyphobacterium]|uniref:Alpha/beta hydrolase n=1 Tax=Hyphobacterium vulgare TaxID=1736751 RepID=A0ABV7A0M2_9PROT
MFATLRAAMTGCLLACLLTACATPIARMPVITPEAGQGEVRTLLVASVRMPSEEPGRRFTDARSPKLNFAETGVWVPNQRDPGEIDYPGQRLDPAREFALTGYAPIENVDAFLDRLNTQLESLPQGDRHAVLFVHGFNTPFSNGLYLNAQILTDFQSDAVGVHFAWPSAGQVSSYLYDRDSAQFSRSGLARTVELLARSEADSITLIAHSMGALLAMEALRELSLHGETGVIERLDAVILASPDIDSDVFRDQVGSLAAMPEHLVVIVSHRDRLLALSSLLRGERAPRVGLGNHAEELTALGVTIIDLTRFGDGGGFNHTTFASSPTLMNMVTSGALEAALMGRSTRENGGPADTIFSLAASIVSLPVRALVRK